MSEKESDQLEPIIPKVGPEIRTERLVLRPLRQSDEDSIFALRSRMEIMKWSLKQVPETDITETRKHMQQCSKPHNLTFVISGADAGRPDDAGSTGNNGQVYGTLGIFLVDSRMSIGYIFHPECWGKGYATEAVTAAIKAWWADYAGVRTLAADLAGPSLFAETSPRNGPSRRVLAKVGFIEVEDCEDEHGPYELWRLDEPGEKA